MLGAKSAKSQNPTYTTCKWLIYDSQKVSTHVTSSCWSGE